jgi:hypothetical protein
VLLQAIGLLPELDRVTATQAPLEPTAPYQLHGDRGVLEADPALPGAPAGADLPRSTPRCARTRSARCMRPARRGSIASSRAAHAGSLSSRLARAAHARRDARCAASSWSRAESPTSRTRLPINDSVPP